MLGELFRGSVGGGPALGEFCCARPERRHGVHNFVRNNQGNDR